MSNDDKPDYEVGYKKPPKVTQFKAGVGGNRSGRPKGSQNTGTILNQIAFKRVAVKENGHTRHITKLELALTQLVNKAAAGDLRALRDLLSWQKILADQEANAGGPVSDQKQKLGIAAVLKRMRKHLDSVLEEDLAKSETGSETAAAEGNQND